MIRTLTISAATLALAAPALAAEAAAPVKADATAVARVQLSQTSAAMQARQHLIRQGYINVSSLEQDENGRWVGSAQKDGKTVYVAIRLPNVDGAAQTN